MNFPRIPMQAVAGIAEFSELAVSIQILRGESRASAEALVEAVPAVLRQAPCFLDRLTGLWLYDFGEPVTTSRGYVYGGGRTWHELTNIIDVLTCARARLENPVLSDYLLRLADPNKHAYML